MVAILTVTLVYISRQVQVQPPLRSWTRLCHEKANSTQNSTIQLYCACRNTANFSHTSRIHFSRHFAHWNEYGENAKKCQKQPLPLEVRGRPSNTWMPGLTPLTTPNDSSIAVHTSTQWCNKVPIGYNEMLQIHLHKTGIFWPGGVQSGLGYFTIPGIVWPRPARVSPRDTMAWAKLYPGLIWARVNLACYTCPTSDWWWRLVESPPAASLTLTLALTLSNGRWRRMGLVVYSAELLYLTLHVQCKCVKVAQIFIDMRRKTNAVSCRKTRGICVSGSLFHDLYHKLFRINRLH